MNSRKNKGINIWAERERERDCVEFVCVREREHNKVRGTRRKKRKVSLE